MRKEFNFKKVFAYSKLRGVLKWLYPGIGIKRWIGLSAMAVILIVFASSNLGGEGYTIVKLLYVIVLISSIVILALSIKRMIRAFISVIVPSSKDTELVDLLYRRRQLSRGPKIVAVGGGTGLSVLLSGLKEFSSNITAVVTVADDGGSSGRLRQQFDMLPPGDVRNCLVALADAPGLMRELFQFRFGETSELKGHSFGNLFITVMTQLTGDFEKAVKETSKVLALRGQVVPSTLSNVVLVAQHPDGSTTEGEDRIPKVNLPIKNVYLRPQVAEATPEAIKAIEEAQVIVLGPGSLYTSIIPNLLIKDITTSIVNSQAIKVYVCNIMTQPGETDGYTASDHVRALVAHSHPRIFDYCIVNTGEIPSALLRRYAQENAFPVINDRKKIENAGYRVIEEDVVRAQETVRHDPVQLAKIILSFIEEI
ncbi:MAG: YvcK family protein [Candidatus Omnitrophica bacterium]|nr:YvcK family protein [Candidatus Omnitrophota bacterium]